jgi:hypothetical protein
MAEGALSCSTSSVVLSCLSSLNCESLTVHPLSVCLDAVIVTVHAVVANSNVDRTSYHSNCRRSRRLRLRSSPSSVRRFCRLRPRLQSTAQSPLAARIHCCKNECHKGKLHHRARGGQTTMTRCAHTAAATAVTCVRSHSGLQTWGTFLRRSI